MKIFLICPVRKRKKRTLKRFLIWIGIIADQDKQEQEAILRYVSGLEEAGHEVHWPPRDTDQDDPIGLRICQDNGQAIKEADEIRIWWNEKSLGSHFDFGMAFILQKKIVLINPQSVQRTLTKSFTNVLLELH